MHAEQVPLLPIEDVYPSEEQRSRYHRLTQRFSQKYGRRPEFFVRAPGRVNLIGEHIDYSGFSVLPMALSRDVVIAVATISKTTSEDIPPVITVANTDSDTYPEERFFHATPLPIDARSHSWVNYFKCGYRGILDARPELSPSELCCLVDGNVPPGAGTSSSSALVCASALATATALGVKDMSQTELAEIAIQCEQNFAGVQIGGMDQTVSTLASPGAALLIEFMPKLKATPVVLPDQEIMFVVTNTLVKSEKRVTAPRCYNLRVVELKLATAVLATKLRLSTIPSTLYELQNMYFSSSLCSENREKLNPIAELEKMSSLVSVHLHEHSYTWSELEELLDSSEEQLRARFVKMDIQVPEEGFELYKRAKHVFEESARVLRFRDMCNGEFCGEETLKTLGSLMKASQSSCRDLFNCSCSELDTLTTLSLEAGAFGSRLTGAGWGGCCVSLIHAKDVDVFISKIASYYDSKNDGKRLTREELEEKGWVLVSKPCRGAAIVNLTEQEVELY